MYNRIPSERTSKQTIVILLLCTIALLSLLAAGYFAWMVRYLQMPATQYSASEESVEEEVSGDQEEVQNVFDYPEIVQVASEEGDVSQTGHVFFNQWLGDWFSVNRDSGYCVQVQRYADDDVLSRSFMALGSDLLADTGVHEALLSYFQVQDEEQSDFFGGIESAIDENDRFAQNASMCSSHLGERKFLLLDDVRALVNAQGVSYDGGFPEVLEWVAAPEGGHVWVDYLISSSPIIDGYSFIPDFHGDALAISSYGDAGYAYWEIYRLERDGSIPSFTLLEKCTLEPTEDYAESAITCEVEYTE